MRHVAVQRMKNPSRRCEQARREIRFAVRGPVEKAERKLLLHTFQQACVQQTICPAFFFCVKSSAYCLVIDWAIHKGLLGSACSWTAITLPSVICGDNEALSRSERVRDVTYGGSRKDFVLTRNWLGRVRRWRHPPTATNGAKMIRIWKRSNLFLTFPRLPARLAHSHHPPPPPEPFEPATASVCNCWK